jgi:hypothetical protein
MPDWRGYRRFGVIEPDLSSNATNRAVSGPLPGRPPSTVYNSGLLRVSWASRRAYPHSVVIRRPTHRTALLALDSEITLAIQLST